MDGRKGDRWTVKPSSVQLGYTLVDTLWVRLEGKGNICRHLGWFLAGAFLYVGFVFEPLGGKRRWGSLQVCYTKGNVFYSLKGPVPALYN